MVSRLGPNVEALAMPSTVGGGATGTPVTSTTSVVDALGHTQRVTASAIQSQQGRSGIRIETEQRSGTKEPLSQTSTKESKALPNKCK